MTDLDATIQVRAAFTTSLPEALIGSLCAALFAASLQFSGAPVAILPAWLAAVIGFYCIRALLAKRYRRRTRSSPRLWGALHRLGALITAALWGGLVFLIPPASEDTHLILLVFWLGVAAVWGGFVHASSIFTMLAFVTIVLAPIFWFLLKPSQPHQWLTAGMLASATVIGLVIAQFVGRLRTRSLLFESEMRQAESLLSKREDQLERLNEALKTGLIQRQTLEADLTEARKALESAQKKSRTLATAMERINDNCPVCGLLNRRAFEERLEQEWRRTLRAPQALALLLVQIDDYQAFQQAHGQKPTDVMLRTVGQTVSAYGRRPEDFAARYGEDKFALLLPGASTDIAKAIAERVRQAVLDERIPHHHRDAREFVSVHISVASMVPVRSLPSRELMQRADSMLYEGEFRGGNRVLGFDALETVGLERWRDARDGTLGRDAMMQKFLVAGLEPSQHNFPPGKNVLASEATSEKHVFGVLRGGLNVIVEGHAMQIRMGDIVRIPAGVCCEVHTDAATGALCLHSVESVEADASGGAIG